MHTVEAIKRAEQEWHDAHFLEHGKEDFPESASDFMRWFDRVHLTPFCEGGWSYWSDTRSEAIGRLRISSDIRILDYGCGSGALGIYLALQGANVWGFDLSTEGVRVAASAAARYGTNARFEQMDAEDLKYDDSFFDVVIGFGVLHHVIKYKKAASQLDRVLKRNGQAIFLETLWDNPLINIVRRVTTTDTEAGDAHLTEKAIYEFCRPFRAVRLDKRNLLYMLKRLTKLPERDLGKPLRHRPFWRLVRSVDHSLLRWPSLERFCGEVIVYLEK